MAKWDDAKYAELTTLLGNLTWLVRDDGEASVNNQIKRLTLTKLAELLLTESIAPRDIAIEGAKMIWNSATSISLGEGSLFAENGDFIQITSTLTLSSLSLSASTWYHLYAYLSSGSPAVELITTAPTTWKGTAQSKTGDTSRRYVGSVLTDGSGNIYSFIHHLQTNEILYTAANGVSPFRVLSSGSATSTTNVACSSVVPVTSGVAKLRFTNSPSSTQVASIGVGSTVIVNLSIASNGFSHLFTDWALDSSRQFSYSFPASGGVLIVDVLGYLFER